MRFKNHWNKATAKCEILQKKLRFDRKNTSSLVNYLKKMKFQCVVISLKASPATGCRLQVKFSELPVWLWNRMTQAILLIQYLLPPLSPVQTHGGSLEVDLENAIWREPFVFGRVLWDVVGTSESGKSRTKILCFMDDPSSPRAARTPSSHTATRLSVFSRTGIDWRLGC